MKGRLIPLSEAGVNPAFRSLGDCDSTPSQTFTFHWQEREFQAPLPQQKRGGEKGGEGLPGMEDMPEM